MDTDSLNSELNKFALVYFYFHFIFVLFQKKKEDITIFAFLFDCVRVLYFSTISIFGSGIQLLNQHQTRRDEKHDAELEVNFS